jgi:hypothetical protein
VIEAIVKVLRQWMTEKKTGNITLNFFKGTLSVIKFEETKKIDEI